MRRILASPSRDRDGKRRARGRRGGVRALVCAALVLVVGGLTVLADTPPPFERKWGSSGIISGQFASPFGVAVDCSGNVYVADTNNHRIQKFDSSGTFVTKWGGSGTGDGQFSIPRGVAADCDGNVYVADTGNNRVQKFTSAGAFLGTWGSGGGGAGEFNAPSGVAVDCAGNVYVADTSNNRIQKFTSAGAFLGTWGSGGGGDGLFNNPQCVAADRDGNVYVADSSNGRVQKFDSSGNFLTKWGSIGTGDGQFGVVRGVAADCSGNVYVVDKDNNRIQKFTSTGTFLAKWGANGGDGTAGVGDGQFNVPSGVAADCSGNVYVTDTNNNRIQKFTGAGTFLGKWGSFGTGDGQFNGPYAVSTDCAGNVYVADPFNNRIQKFDSSGNFLTKWGSLGTGDGQFNNPLGVLADCDGNVYVADTANNRIQKFDSSGNFLMKWGSVGLNPGQFNGPSGLDFDSSGNLYIVDGNSRVQKFTTTGTFLLAWGSGGTGDGQFDGIFSVAVDSSDNVYVADGNNNRIQKFDSAGNFLMKWGTSGTGNGQFSLPRGVAVDCSDNVYVADTTNNRIQKFTSTGTFVAKWGANGGDGTSGSGDGAFNRPRGIWADCAGNVYVADTNNNRIQRFSSGTVSAQLTPSSDDFTAAGGMGSLTVNTGDHCPWASVGVPVWITGFPDCGEGPDTVEYTVEANTGPARSATFTIAGQSFTVNQAEECMIAPTTTSADLGAGSSSDNTLGVDAGEECAWTADTADSWIHLTSFAGTGSGSVLYDVDANTGAARSGTIMLTGGASFTVNQDAPPPPTNTVQFDAAAYTVDETDPSVTVTVTRGDTAGPASVKYATASGKATSGKDFLSKSGTLSFAAGEASKSFDVTMVGDDLVEGYESFLVKLSSPTGGMLLGAQRTAVVTILDDDEAGTFGFDAPSYPASEGGNATLTVNRIDGFGAASVKWSATSMTATVGTDTVSPNSGTLAFAAGETSRQIAIPIVDDGTLEGFEHFRVTLMAVTVGALIEPGARETDVIVEDGDGTPPGFELDAEVYPANEGDVVTVTVMRPTAGVVGKVKLQTANGSATSGGDYVGLNTTLVFGASDTELTRNITINGDTLAEGRESFTVKLVAVTGGGDVGVQRAAVVQIADDDGSAGVIEFADSVTTAGEADGFATVTVKRSGGTNGTVTVKAATSNGTATVAGADYTTTSVTVTFADGQDTATVQVPIGSDGLVEGNETVNLTLSTVKGGAQLGENVKAVLVIVDDDTP